MMGPCGRVCLRGPGEMCGGAGDVYGLCGPGLACGGDNTCAVERHEPHVTRVWAGGS